MVFLTAGILPATTARRTHHVTLKRAFAIHILAAIVSLPVMVVLSAIPEVRGSLSVTAVLGECQHFMDDIIESFVSDPKSMTTITIIAVLVGEAFFLLVAFILMPWGARDEPMRKSYRNALQRAWLHSAHALLLILLAGTLNTSVDRAHYRAMESTFRSYPNRPQAPQIPKPKDATTPEWKEHENAMSEYNKEILQREQAWDKQPWFIKHSEIVYVNAIFVSISWLFWALLRAVGAPRSTVPIVRPPRCDECGYNLTTIPLEGRCPECGDPVATSLGPDARPGTDWQRRRGVGRVVGWLECFIGAVFRSKQLGRRIRTIEPGTDHRLFQLLHLPVFALLGAALVLAVFDVDFGRGPKESDISVVAVAVPGMGQVAALCPVVIALLGAGLVGVVLSYRAERNLLPASMQIAAYLMGFLIVWGLFAVMTFVMTITFANDGRYDELATMLRINAGFLSLWCWLLPNGVWGGYFLILIARGTRAARYANR